MKLLTLYSNKKFDLIIKLCKQCQITTYENNSISLYRLKCIVHNEKLIPKI